MSIVRGATSPDTAGKQDYRLIRELAEMKPSGFEGETEMRNPTVVLFVCISALLTTTLGSGCLSQADRVYATADKTDEQIRTGTWRVFADVPAPRFGGAAAVVQDKLHLFGGVNMNPHTQEG